MQPSDAPPSLGGFDRARETANRLAREFESGNIPDAEDAKELVHFITACNQITHAGSPVRDRERLAEYLAEQHEVASKRRKAWQSARVASMASLIGEPQPWFEQLVTDASRLADALLTDETPEESEDTRQGVVAFVTAVRALQVMDRETVRAASRVVAAVYGEEAKEAVLLGEATVPADDAANPTLEEEARLGATANASGKSPSIPRAPSGTLESPAPTGVGQRARHEPAANEDLDQRFDEGMAGLEAAVKRFDRLRHWSTNADPSSRIAVLNLVYAYDDLKGVLSRFPVAGADDLREAPSLHELLQRRGPSIFDSDRHENGVTSEHVSASGMDAPPTGGDSLDTAGSAGPPPPIPIVDGEVPADDEPTRNGHDSDSTAYGLMESPSHVEPVTIERSHTESVEQSHDDAVASNEDAWDATNAVEVMGGGSIKATSTPSLGLELAREMIATRRTSIAWQIARKVPELHQFLPITLLELASLGEHIREPGRTLAGAFTEGLNKALDEVWPETAEVGLLAFAAGLVPSITAPSTGSAALLERAIEYLQHSEDFNDVVPVARAAARFAERGHPLSLSLLRQVLHKSSVEDAARNARLELNTWFRTIAPNLSTAYPTATRVWQKWLHPSFDSGFGAWMEAIDRGEKAVAKRVLRELEVWRDPAQLNTLIERTVRTVGNSRTRREAVIGKARRAIERNTHTALELFATWAEYELERDAGIAPYMESAIEDLRVGFGHHVEGALTSLEGGTQLLEDHHAAMQLARSVLDSLGTVFKAEGSFERREPALSRVRGWEAALAGLPTGPEGIVEMDDISSLQVLLDDNRLHPMDWRARIDALLGARDARTASFVLSNAPVAEAEAEAIRDHIQAVDDAARTEARTALEVLEVKIDRAASIEVLDEGHRRVLSKSLSHLLSELRVEDGERRFGQDLRRIALLREEYERAEEAALAARATELERLKPRIGVPTYARIRRVLETRDLVTVAEYLLMASAGRELPSEQESRNVLAEFLEAQDAIALQLNGPTASFVAKVRRRNLDSRLQRPDITAERAENAAVMLDAWYQLASIGGIEKFEISRHRSLLSTLLEGVGFSPQELKYHRVQRKAGFAVMRVAPTANRARIPVPAFGSQSGGEIPIPMFWASSSEDAVFTAIGADDARHGRAIVLYFGRLDARRRRSLARTMRERKIFDVIVLDEILLAFLACEVGDRLPVLFRTALPFALSEPYSTLSGFVAPEMFYGRDEAKRSLISPTGSSFVYGGRQLGKTALLREVARTSHLPSAGKVAVWADLKHEMIGISRPARALVDDLLVKRLSGEDSKVLRSNVRSWEKIQEGIGRFLAESDLHQVLMLLDEADAFLEADERNGFEVTTFLKGLMDQTNRRFKVVFAGLHNVQRTTRRANHPLAHLGEAICVGPLLIGEDWAAGMDLVRQPLAAIGYRISDDLVCRILALTNYYPSLLQLYCAHLTRYLNALPIRPSSGEPPFEVSDEHLDAVYATAALRNEFRHKFDLTLQLDDRYEILAYCVAFLSHNEPQHVAAEGFSTERIRDEALQYWPGGFEAARGLDGFRALLEEMEGLGVLRGVANNGHTTGYVLRNPNVMSLLGPADEIPDKLLQRREVQETYDPYSFRNTFSIGGLPWLAPITVANEDNLRAKENVVTVIEGSLASDLTRVAPYLQTLVSGSDQEHHQHVADTSVTAAKFRRLLGDAISMAKDKHLIITVDPGLLWDTEWLRVAWNFTHGLSLKKTTANVVFLADPDKVDYLVRHAAEVDVLIGETISLGRWSNGVVRAFLEDRHYPRLDGDGRERLKHATGFWPAVLEKLHRETLTAPHAVLDHVNDLIDDLQTPATGSAWLAELVGENSALRSTLSSIAEITGPGEAIDVEMLADYSGKERSEVRRHLVCAERLGVILKRGPDSFELSAFERTVAAHAFPDDRS